MGTTSLERRTAKRAVSLGADLTNQQTCHPPGGGMKKNPGGGTSTIAGAGTSAWYDFAFMIREGPAAGVGF